MTEKLGFFINKIYNVVEGNNSTITNIVINERFGVGSSASFVGTHVHVMHLIFSEKIDVLVFSQVFEISPPFSGMSHMVKQYHQIIPKKYL